MLLLSHAEQQHRYLITATSSPGLFLFHELMNEAGTERAFVFGGRVYFLAPMYRASSVRLGIDGRFVVSGCFGSVFGSVSSSALRVTVAVPTAVDDISLQSADTQG